jgi:hypothetical protein
VKPAFLNDQSREPTPEEVQSGVLDLLEKAIQEELRELEHANRSRPLNSVAWIARNLLELSIWTAHCVQSAQNARQLFDDAARDTFDALKLPDRFSIDPEFSFEAMRANMISAAEEKGVLGLDENYKHVADAAKALGLSECFKWNNKLLSKFAHPTALWIMTESEQLEGFRELLYSGGLLWGREALKVMNEFRSGHHSHS